MKTETSSEAMNSAGRRSAPASSALVAFSGLVASGKSTVARALAQHLDATRVEADALRRTVVEEAKDSGATDPLWSFDPAIEEWVYGKLVREAERLLWSGRAVVLDAGFPTRATRAAARTLARSHGIAFLLVECRVDPETARTRLEERDRAGADSGWSDLYALYARHYEPVDELGDSEHLVVDGTRPVEEILQAVSARLEALEAESGA
jgi:predicted kinase